MRQLSGHDASFLYADSTHANANVTFVQIYDQRTAPGGKVRFKSILAHIEGRLHRSPVFRSRLLRVPFELDYPYWVEDEHFDLEYHVRHIALPQPGDWRQFCIQASRIHARALDLNRPLWEIYVIEGLDSITDLPAGSFALLTKVHHAAIDPETRNELVEVLHDRSASAPPPEPGEPWFPEPAPGALSLMLRGAVQTALSPLKLTGPILRLLPSAMAFANDLLHPEEVAATRFNAVVSPHRVFETRRFMVDEFERIRRLVPKATLDDAVLAVCGGGLRRYLASHGELPDEDLEAVVALPLGHDDGSAAARNSPLRVRLGTPLADPVERLAAIQAQTSSPQTLARAETARDLTELGEQVPAAALALTSRLLGRGGAERAAGAPLAACTIAHVAAPPEAQYLAGAHMNYFSAILPIADGMGLVYAVTRYEDRIVISPTSCRELMPDPQAFAQYLRDSFQEYLALAAAAQRLRPQAPRGSAAGRRPPAARKAGSGASGPRAAPAGRRRSTAPPR
jgi:WS/DGAT/MGAT family acyltransferase